MREAKWKKSFDFDYNLKTWHACLVDGGILFSLITVVFLKNGPFLSNQRFKKGAVYQKVLFIFLRLVPHSIKLFLHTLCKKRTFCYPTTFFESLITDKRSICEERYISYGKRQKRCALIVI